MNAALGGSTTIYADVMQIEITDDAQALLTKKGGTMSIDYIKALG